MSRRIDVELTSAREDGTWTWRAAGAKQPKGVVDGALLPQGAKVGDVLKAEADFEIDGIFLRSIVPPKEDKRPQAEQIEIVGSRRSDGGVTTSLTSKGGRGDRGDRADRGPRRDGDRRERGPRRDGAQGATHDWRAKRAAPADERRGRAERPERGERPERRERGERPERGPRQDRERTAAPRPKRLSPGNAHRAAVLDALAPEERAIAEHVVRGGIPAVRRAIQEQNATLRTEGKPEIAGEPLLALAEELLPRLKSAEWRDRAEAALKDVDEIALRDLRSVVSTADAAARDDEARALASRLREALDRRLAQQRDAWLGEMSTCLEEGRVVRALRVASRPPDPSVRVPADMAVRLAEAAGQAMAPDAPLDRWSALLEAVAASPVRRTVKPAGLPENPPDALVQAARQAAGSIPALAPLLGIDMPPPPAPSRGARRPPRPPRPPRAQSGQGPRRPPAPAAPPPEQPAAGQAQAPGTGQAAPVQADQPAQPQAAEQAAPTPAEQRAQPEPAQQPAQAEPAPVGLESAPAEQLPQAESPAEQAAPAQEPAGDVAPAQEPAGDVAPAQEPAGDVAPAQEPAGDVAPAQEPAGSEPA